MSQSTTYLIIAAVLLIVIGVPLLVSVNRENVRQMNGTQYSKKVVFVGLDGLGTANIASTSTPNFDSLKLNGKYTKATIDPNSNLSGPNWVGMLTGHTSDTSGIGLSNDCTQPDYPTLFDEFPSAVFAQWKTITCYSNNIKRVAKNTISPGKLFHQEELKKTLNGSETFVFIHIYVLDASSHTYGASSQHYKSTLQELDKTFLPFVIDYIDDHNATFILSADHGSDLKSVGHSWDTVPLIFYGEGVEAINLPVLAESRDVYYYVHFLLGQ